MENPDSCRTWIEFCQKDKINIKSGKHIYIKLIEVNLNILKKEGWLVPILSIDSYT